MDVSFKKYRADSRKAEAAAAKKAGARRREDIGQKLMAE